MNGVTLKCRVRFGKEPGRGPQAVGNSKKVSPVARRLALAYRLDRMVEAGEVESYAEGARILAVSRARMAQIMSLLSLSAEIQESLLLGTLHLSERRARELKGDPLWESQRP